VKRGTGSSVTRRPRSARGVYVLARIARSKSGVAWEWDVGRQPISRPLGRPKGRPKLSGQGPGGQRKRGQRGWQFLLVTYLGGDMSSSTWKQCRPVNRVVRTMESKGTKVQRMKHIPRVAPLLFQLDDDQDLRWRGISAGTRARLRPTSHYLSPGWASLGRFCHDNSIHLDWGS